MTVRKGSVVTFHYTGCFENGEVFGSTREKEPLKCKIGEGKIIPGIEEALLGMKKSEKKDVVITPDKAFGDRDERLIRKVPKNVAGVKDVEIGQVLTMKNESGQYFDVRIVAIEENTITADFNHPLAGKILNFAIEVMNVSE